MTSLADLRATIPDLDGLDDAQAVNYIQQVYYPSLDPSVIAGKLGVRPPEPEPEKRSLWGTTKDLGVSALKSAIAVPETVVGLADLATGGEVGKALENEGGMLGFRPKQANAMLDEMYSPAQKAANAKVDAADGIVDTAAAALSNPSTIVHGAVQSAGSMLAGAPIARGAMALAPKLPGLVAAGLGESAATAGQNAEQVRQATKDGLLTGEQSAIIAASGALTGAIAGVAGKVANKLGISDINQMIAGVQRAAPDVQKGVIRKIAEGFAAEGLLQEFPQSAQEQIAQNVALGKPWSEGVEKAAVMGALSGGLIGGVAGPVGGAKRVPEDKPSIPDILAAQDVDTAIDAAAAAVAAPVSLSEAIATAASRRPAMLDEFPVGVPVGEATEVQSLPVGEVADMLPVGEATELAPIPTGEAVAITPEVVAPSPPALPEMGGTFERTMGMLSMDADRARAEQQRLADLERLPADVAEQNVQQAAVQRAATVEAPTAMQLAMQRASTPSLVQANAGEMQANAGAPAAPAEPRIVERTPEMRPMSRLGAEQRAAAAPGSEVVAIRNRSGKLAYTVLQPEQAAIRPGDLLTGDGFPYGSRTAASIRAKKEGPGFAVVEAPGGFVVRKATSANDVERNGEPATVDGGRSERVGGLPDQRPADVLPGPADVADEGGGRDGSADLPRRDDGRPAGALTVGATFESNGSMWNVTEATDRMIRAQDAQGNKRMIAVGSKAWQEITQAQAGVPAEGAGSSRPTPASPAAAPVQADSGRAADAPVSAAPDDAEPSKWTKRDYRERFRGSVALGEKMAGSLFRVGDGYRIRIHLPEGGLGEWFQGGKQFSKSDIKFVQRIESGSRAEDHYELATVPKAEQAAPTSAQQDSLTDTPLSVLGVKQAEQAAPPPSAAKAEGKPDAVAPKREGGGEAPLDKSVPAATLKERLAAKQAERPADLIALRKRESVLNSIRKCLG